MSLHQRRDSSGRTRFLLALTLSTVTAIGVAAPLAIQAVRADDVRFVGPADGGRDPADDDQSEGDGNPRSLTDASGDAKGGIGSRPPAKAKAQTSKSETSKSSTSPTTASRRAPALTNPASPSVTDTTVADEPDSGVGSSTTPPPDPDGASTTSTTERAESTTTTTNPAVTTSSSSPSTTSSTVASTSSVTTEP